MPARFRRAICAQARKVALLKDLGPKELGFYFSLAQVGMEMVLPMVVGIGLDHYLGWKPWGTVTGALVGFIGGLTHLVLLVQRHDADKDRHKPQGDAR